MSQNHSYAIQELHKKIENLSVAHDKLCAIVNAQSHIIKIIKTFHVDDFRKLEEEKIKRKNNLLTRNSKTRSNTNTNNFNRNQSNQLERKSYNSNINNTQFSNNNQNSQQSFDAEYEEMKKQVSLLQSQLTQLTALPQNTTSSVSSAPVPVASNSTTTNAPAPTTV
jgi:hypothetical protein